MSQLSIQGVSRVFESSRGQRTQALLPVDFEVRDNDFVTILGPSGCGKSTLLRIVAGLDHPFIHDFFQGERGRRAMAPAPTQAPPTL